MGGHAGLCLQTSLPYTQVSLELVDCTTHWPNVVLRAARRDNRSEGTRVRLAIAKMSRAK